MAYADPTRTRFRLTELELAAAGVVLQFGHTAAMEVPEAADDLDRLREAELLTDGLLDPQLTLLVDVLRNARVDIVVEVSGVGEASHLAWLGDELGVVGIDVGDERFEYVVVDPVLLPWALATALGVGARPSPERTPCRLSTDLLEQVFERLMAEDPEVVREEFSRQVEASTAAQVVDLLLSRRASWRASSRLPRDDADDLATTITVIDGGTEGFWRLTDDLAGNVELHPMLPSDVWEELHHLIPLSDADDEQ